MSSKFFRICTILALLPILGCSEVTAPSSDPVPSESTAPSSDPASSSDPAPPSANGIPQDNAQALRILPLGDSITQADSNHQSYRPRLWQLLGEEGIDVDFVGSLDGNYSGSPTFPAEFDPNHEGHWGWRSDEILHKLPQWLQHYDADISLIHLGTNDCLQNQPATETLGELTQIVGQLRQDNPYIMIAFSTLGPTTWQNQQCLEQINQGLIELQSKLDTPESAIVVVHTDQNLEPHKHLYDGLHLNSSGEQIIALAWFNTIKSWLSAKPP